MSFQALSLPHGASCEKDLGIPRTQSQLCAWHLLSPQIFGPGVPVGMPCGTKRPSRGPQSASFPSHKDSWGTPGPWECLCNGRAPWKRPVPRGKIWGNPENLTLRGPWKASFLTQRLVGPVRGGASEAHSAAFPHTKTRGEALGRGPKSTLRYSAPLGIGSYHGPYICIGIPRGPGEPGGGCNSNVTPILARRHGDLLAIFWTIFHRFFRCPADFRSSFS